MFKREEDSTSSPGYNSAAHLQTVASSHVRRSSLRLQHEPHNLRTNSVGPSHPVENAPKPFLSYNLIYHQSISIHSRPACFETSPPETVRAQDVEA